MAQLVQGASFEEVHDEERLALVAQVVVGDGDARRMVDGVRDLPLAEEALADLHLARELRVEDLHCGARAVAVPRGEHRAHASDAEQALERPLRVQRGADPGLGGTDWVISVSSSVSLGLRGAGLGHQCFIVHRAVHAFIGHVVASYTGNVGSRPPTAVRARALRGGRAAAGRHHEWAGESPTSDRLLLMGPRNAAGSHRQLR